MGLGVIANVYGVSFFGDENVLVQGWELRNFVNLPKPTVLYTLEGWIVCYVNYITIFTKSSTPKAPHSWLHQMIKWDDFLSISWDPLQGVPPPIKCVSSYFPNTKRLGYLQVYGFCAFEYKRLWSLSNSSWLWSFAPHAPTMWPWAHFFKFCKISSLMCKVGYFSCLTGMVWR